MLVLSLKINKVSVIINNVNYKKVPKPLLLKSVIIASIFLIG